MSDIDERLEEEIIHASRKSFESQQAGMNANFLMDIQSEIERLRADLAAVTEERDRMREALNNIAERHIPDQPASDGKDEADYVRTHYAQLRWIAKRAALEGVKENKS